MKFNDMPYKMPEIETIKEEISLVTQNMKTAKIYEDARAALIAMDQEDKKVSTQAHLAFIRHSIDTRIEFYDSEMKFWNSVLPQLQEYVQAFDRAMLESPFRAQLEEEFGEVVFKNIEIEIRRFAPALIPFMQEENDLVQEYQKIIASAQIPFENGVYTLSQLTPFKRDKTDVRRLAAWMAEGQWYKEHQKDLDRIYDRLVQLRDQMGRELGHDGFTELGYDRMNRICYRKAEVEKFREAVRKYVVPVADQIYRKQAERLGVQYPLSFADMALEFRSGNPTPVGSEEDILGSGQIFYDSLSEETGSFFRMMRENELMDVSSKEGKEGGGYCESIPDYGVPFIFANFNGTQHDVEVVTHEAGHAFAAYMNRERVPSSTVWPSLEGCEVHSMSMEFFAWPWAEQFFGSDTQKYLYSHLASALTFIPYGTMVDHFQHEVYEKPQMTPAERHGVWKRLLGVYMPWVRLDGEIPFYSEGEGWQRQHHIYTNPYYYIDYCLAQTVSLEFWSMIRKDVRKAWEKYMTYTMLGGSDVFTGLLAKANLESPFDGECLRKVCAEAAEWLENFDESALV